MRMIGKAVDACISVLASVAGLALGFLLLAICYSTFSRFVFNNPMSNLIEYSAYSLIYITFLGAPWILKQRAHITVDVILEALKPRMRSLVGVFTDAAGAVVSALIFWFGTLVTVSNIQNHIKVMDSMGTPQFILVIAIPIGSFFLTIQFLRNAAEDYRVWKDAKAGGAK